MSFSWDAIDERERQRFQRDKDLKEFLLVQQSEAKSRKRAERFGDLAAPPNQPGYGGPPATGAPAPPPVPQNQGRLGQQRAVPVGSQPQAPPPPSLPLQATSQVTGSERSTSALDYLSSLLSPPSQPLSSIGLSSTTPPPPLPTSLALSSQPTTTATEDLLAKLRLSDEQLQNERRTRSWMEAELQLGKQLLASLSAKVDKLQELHAAEAQALRQVARQAEQAERAAAAAAQEIAARVDRDQGRLQAAVADVAARVRATEAARSDEVERQRMVMDEVNGLRYRLESFSMQSTEVGSEFKSRAREWEVDAQRGADAMRAVKEHEHVLETLQHTVGASTEAVSKRVETAMLEMRQRIDSEGRARFHFEHGMRELYSEIRKTLATQDRDVHDRFESLKQQVHMTLDRERQEREKLGSSVMEHVRNLEKAVRESMQIAVDKMASQISAAEDVITQERGARSKFENTIKTELEGAFKIVQSAVVKKFDEMQATQTEARHAVSTVIKTLKESIVLVEKTSDQKLLSVEEVVRAEIRSRMETDRALSDLKVDLESRSSVFEQRATEAIAEAVQEARANTAKIEEDLKRTAEQLIEAKARSLEDLEKQVVQIRKRIKDGELDVESKFRQLQLETEKVAHEAVASAEGLQGRFEEKFAGVSKEFEATQATIRGIEDLCDKTKIAMDEKMNFRILQLDSAMEAFKVELELRVTKKDAKDTEKLFEATVGSIQSSISNLQQALQAVRDNVETRCSKKDLSDAETRSKLADAGLTARIVEIDSAFIQLREEFAAKATKKELDDVDAALKSMIIALQVKDVAVEELFGKLQEDVNERINRKHLTEVEDRLKNSILNLETRDIEFGSSIAELKDAISIRPTRTEISDSEKKVMSAVYTLQDRISDVSANVSEAKTEISQTVREDVEEMVASINGAMDAVQARADKLDNALETVKSRLTDSDATTRARIQLVTSSMEGMISENVVAIGKLKEASAQQVQDLSTKIDDLPRQIKLIETHFDEFRKQLGEQARADADRFAHAAAELRDALAGKLDAKEFDALQTAFHAATQKLTAQLEIASMTAEHARAKLQEAETAARERAAELRAAQERAVDDLAAQLRAVRDGTGKRLDDVDGRLAPVPKAVDAMWAELRRLRFEQDERIRGDIARVEKDVAAARAEAAACVTARGVDAAVAGAMVPVVGKVDRLARDVEDVRAALRPPLSRASDAYERRPPSAGLASAVAAAAGAVPLARAPPASDYPARGGNFYKPEPVARGAPDDGPQPMPSSSSLPPIGPTQSTTVAAALPPKGALDRIKSLSRASSNGQLVDGRRTGSSDPVLERMADLAVAQSLASAGAGAAGAAKMATPPMSPPTREF